MSEFIILTFTYPFFFIIIIIIIIICGMLHALYLRCMWRCSALVRCKVASSSAHWALMAFRSRQRAAERSRHCRSIWRYVTASAVRTHSQGATQTCSYNYVNYINI